MTVSTAHECHAARLVTLRESGQLPEMQVDISPATLVEIGRRLRRLRELLGHDTQTSFAKYVGLQRNRYVQYEIGERFLTREAAFLIRAKTQCPLDYLYFGDTHGLPAALRELALPSTDAAA